MTGEGLVYQSGSFVLRIWWEEQDENPAWRGWVQHAASGEDRYFHDLADLLAFVEARTGQLTEPANPSHRERVDIIERGENNV